MKQLFKTILLAIMVVACGTSAMAQANNNRKMSREDLAVKQAKYIAHELAFDEATTGKYVDTYCQYQQELWKLGPKHGLTTGQRLERSQQILDLRKRYHTIYSGFLTEQQVERAYQIEKRLLYRMSKNKSKGKNQKKHR